MNSFSARNKCLPLTDWQIFTNDGNFDNRVPPSRRLVKRSSCHLGEINVDIIRSRCRSARSRNQAAISTSTRRILSARSIKYRRTPRVEPIEFDLKETSDDEVSRPTGLVRGRASTACSQRSRIWDRQSWSFSYLHRAIIAIDQQARKDYQAARIMNALAAWQNALAFCQELTHRTQLWPENKAQLDEEIATLTATYRKHLEEMTKSHKAVLHNRFAVPRKICRMCRTEQLLDQYHERWSCACQHVERSVCNQCIYREASSRAEKRNIDMTCPESHCRARLSLKQLRQRIEVANRPKSVDANDPRAKSQSLERRSEFIWCAHEQCGSGQFHVWSQFSTPMMTCVLCKRQTCAAHQVKWHKGVTCKQYDEQRQAAAITEKQCPKCQVLVETNLKSDRAVCSKCKYEYCPECKADYKAIQKSGASQHKTTCSRFKNVPTKEPSKSRTCTIL